MDGDRDALLLRLEALERRVQQLETENGALRSRHAPVPDVASDEAMSRRGVLRKSAAVVGAGVAMAAAGGLLNPHPARAAAGDPVVLGQSNDSGGALTSIQGSNSGGVLRLNGTSSAPGLRAFGASGYGVYAKSSSNASIFAEKLGSGGSALLVRISNATNSSSAINVATSGTGVGILAGGARGGQFGGRQANIRLHPTGDVHPTSGLVGDIFVDNSARLWFCKGGTNWSKIV